MSPTAPPPPRRWPLGTVDGQGRTTVRLRVENEEVGYSQLFALGPECEVLAPPSLRARFGEAARRTAALYAEGRSEDRAEDQS